MTCRPAPKPQTLTGFPTGSTFTKRKPAMLRALLAFLILSAVALRADVSIPIPVEQLTAKAGLIAQGKVSRITVQRDPQGRIYTRVELDVSETWKGHLPTNHCVIVHGGGVLGEEQAVVTGQAEYEVGEEVVAFLIQNPRGDWVSIGLAQGEFHVDKDPTTGEKVVHNPFHGHGQTPPSATTPPDSKRRMSLGDLKKKVGEGAK